MFIDKSGDNLVVCEGCNQVKPRRDLKYVGYIFSPNCFCACSECRARWAKSRFKRFFIRSVE